MTDISCIIDTAMSTLEVGGLPGATVNGGEHITDWHSFSRISLDGPSEIIKYLHYNAEHKRQRDVVDLPVDSCSRRVYTSTSLRVSIATRRG